MKEKNIEMDIKKEPEEEAEWKKYKEKFVEDYIRIEKEKNDDKSSFDSEVMTIFQESSVDFGNVNYEINFIPEHENANNSFRIKIEKTASEELCSQERTEEAQACISNNPFSETPYEVHDNAMDDKKELVEYKVMNSSDSLKSNNNDDHCLNIPFSKIVATIKLTSIPFHKRYFICSVCYDFFPTSAKLNLHEAIHKQSTSGEFKSDSGRRPNFKFKCDKCGYGCRHLSVLKIHRMSHSGEKPYTCQECDRAFSRLYHLKKHTMTHSGEKPFKCDKCNYSCIQSSNMKSHRMIHVEEKPFNCKDCKRSFRRIYDFNKHRMTHTGQKPYKCPECGYSCIYSERMKVHRLIHVREKPYKCSICRYSCFRLDVMSIHEMVHSDGKPHEEVNCDSSSALESSEVIFAVKKLFKCEHCDYSCSCPSGIKRHRMIHSGEKPFKCEQCDYTCIRSDYMSKHKMIHSGETRFSCEHCDYRCIHSGQIKRHRLVHKQLHV